MKDSKDKDGRGRPSTSFIAGAVALVFLIIGYQAALFIHKAAVARIVANHDHPDTVYITGPMDTIASNSEYSPGRKPEYSGGGSFSNGSSYYSNGSRGSWSSARRGSKDGKEANEYEYRRDTFRSRSHSAQAEEIRRANTPRRYESFRFNPNTASIDDLMRLGFSQKQAQSIDNYRKKGGRFRRKSDFARSYVVEDSVYQRLEKFIDIPRMDINKADSATFETLPGIGKFFAAKMVSYRDELGGYSYPEQLMDIWHFDAEKYDGLKDLIMAGSSSYPEYPLWTLPEEKLARHPYIGKRSAHGIVLFRDNSPKSEWTVENLLKAGVLDPEKGARLARCRIEAPRQQ